MERTFGWIPPKTKVIKQNNSREVKALTKKEVEEEKEKLKINIDKI